MTRAPATAKINLALVVGGLRPEGKHELVTVYQRVTLSDRVAVEPATRLHVSGFPEDTIVRRALEALAAEAGRQPSWHVRLTKRIPVAAGLGGGSSDAATALRLANASLPHPLEPERLHAVAAAIGADVPFFLTAGPQLGRGDGTDLGPLELPQDYVVVLLLPARVQKQSTATVYRAFDERGGAHGFDERRARLLEALGEIRTAADLASLPANDLAQSPLAASLRRVGAFRADVSGAGPTVYGLFQDAKSAETAARSFRGGARAIVTRPCWYG
jgi:4-diphosphocytidyl-2-C-methyl-D-erythritol kinase